ncbi:hypothetical protein IWX90DRAFT_170267 [Phyllosticta citrichinensis]|uniref:Uncharacterized protein n=1 Tax=Phyllosticta citrichinensis TaxID=1130410 RepID=A0ABR1Y1I1_9PEZI
MHWLRPFPIPITAKNSAPAIPTFLAIPASIVCPAVPSTFARSSGSATPTIPAHIPATTEPWSTSSLHVSRSSETQPVPVVARVFVHTAMIIRQCGSKPKTFAGPSHGNASTSPTTSSGTDLFRLRRPTHTTGRTKHHSVVVLVDLAAQDHRSGVAPVGVTTHDQRLVFFSFGCFHGKVPFA